MRILPASVGLHHSAGQHARAVGVLMAWVNLYPTVLKARIMKGGNPRANMYIYKVFGPQEYLVFLEEEGDIGRYNRANRSLHHLIEYSKCRRQRELTA